MPESVRKVKKVKDEEKNLQNVIEEKLTKIALLFFHSDPKLLLLVHFDNKSL